MASGQAADARTSPERPERGAGAALAAAIVAVLLLAGFTACAAGDKTGSPAPSARGSTIGGTAGAAGRATAGPTVGTGGAAPDAGGLVSAEPAAAFKGKGTSFKVRYRSTGVDGSLVEVTGVVYRPDGPAPAGGFPVVSTAHGTTGVGDSCAPSVSGMVQAPVGPFLDAGWVVVSTDYEGLGTAGMHPYLVGMSEARSLLDIARAARQIDGLDASSTVALWGHSQGGHAVLFAAGAAASYAPDLTVRSAVAGAPPWDLDRVLPSGATGRSPLLTGFSLLAVSSWAGTYPDLDLAGILTPTGRDIASRSEEMCSAEFTTEVARYSASDLFSADMATLPQWSRLLEDNTFVPRDTGIPILLVQGERDELVSAAATRELAQRLCSEHAAVVLDMDPTGDHISSAVSAVPRVVSFISDGFAGKQPSSTC